MPEVNTYHTTEPTADPTSDVRQAAEVIENPAEAERAAVAEALDQAADGLSGLEHHAVGDSALETAQQWRDTTSDASPEQEATLLNRLEAVAAYCRYVEDSRLPPPERREAISDTLWELQSDGKAFSFIVDVDMAKYREAREQAGAISGICWTVAQVGIGMPPEELNERQKERLLTAIERIREFTTELGAAEAQPALDALEIRPESLANRVTGYTPGHLS
jgi:hypothetical protein